MAQPWSSHRAPAPSEVSLGTFISANDIAREFAEHIPTDIDTATRCEHCGIDPELIFPSHPWERHLSTWALIKADYRASVPYLKWKLGFKNKQKQERKAVKHNSRVERSQQLKAILDDEERSRLKKILAAWFLVYQKYRIKHYDRNIQRYEASQVVARKPEAGPNGE